MDIIHGYMNKSVDGWFVGSLVCVSMSVCVVQSNECMEIRRECERERDYASMRLIASFDISHTMANDLLPFSISLVQ